MTRPMPTDEVHPTILTDVLPSDPNTTITLPAEPTHDVVAWAAVDSAADREETIRVLAYAKWEAAGCPAGDGVDFWLEAEQEVATVVSA